MKPLITVALLVLCLAYAFAPSPSLSVGAPPDSTIEARPTLVVTPVAAPVCKDGVCSVGGGERVSNSYKLERGQPVRNVARLGGRVLNALRPRNWFRGCRGC